MNRMLVDIGNTAFHVLFENKLAVLYSKQDVINYLSSCNLTSTNCYVSQVNSHNYKIFKDVFLLNNGRNITELSNAMYPKYLSKLGYKIDNIDILGGDLFFDIIACDKLTLLADYGTASKFLFVDENYNFVGGAIGPGLKLINKALFNSTELLDDFKLDIPDKLFSLSTKDAINSSSSYGEGFKLIGYYNYLKKYYNTNVSLVLTGGDSILIAKILKEKLNFDSFIYDELHVFKGINKFVNLLEREEK